MQTRNSYFLIRALLVYCIALLFCCLLFFNHLMLWYWIIAGLGEIILFYSLSTYWEQDWSNISAPSFTRRAFFSTVLIRLLWILGYYLFTTSVWHTPWEQPIGTTMDSSAYFDEALWLNEMIKAGDVSPYLFYLSNNSISDAGYPIFLALCNFVFNNSIILTRIPNAFFDAWTVILTYRLAKRHFGESIGRISAIFVILMPMVIFYSGVTMKESIMLMLSMWAVERGDFIIREKPLRVGRLISFIVLILSVTLFRTALAWVIVLAFLCALVLTSERILRKSRKILLLSLILLGGALFFGGAILEQGEEILEQSESTGANFDYRATRKGGNVLVSSLNKAALAPLLFTLPFPSMVDIEGQSIQQLQNGGYYIKNILSFFCIFALLSLIPKKKWSNHVFIIAYLLGYLAALGLSSFAHSGRFHHPVIPIEMVFAVYGISLVRNIKQARWFDYFLVVELIIIIVWNWFKLRGRGLV